MALKIKKKLHPNKTKAVLTILGIQGGRVEKESVLFSNFEHKSRYYEREPKSAQEYFNTLPLLCEKFLPQKYKIIPITTKESKLFNIEVLKTGYPHLLENVEFDDKYLIKDEKEIDEIFHLYNDILDEYDEVIVDVTHGFRHLPILMIVELIIQHFKSIEKIKHIYFAKEIQKHTFEQQGLYEIIDLKKYVDLANISFILTNFGKNFTVANHIASKEYEALIDALNDFSNDMMALNLNNLFNQSAPKLIAELEKIEEISIKIQAQSLKKYIQKIANFKEQKRYKSYFDLSKELFEKNYMLISLSLLYESARLYIKTTIKSKHKMLVESVEKNLENDLYKICDFFLKFKNNSTPYGKIYDSTLSKNEMSLVKQAFPKLLNTKRKYTISNKELSLLDAIAYTRNNLAHGNVKGSYLDIQKGIKELINEYEKKCINNS